MLTSVIMGNFYYVTDRVVQNSELKKLKSVIVELEFKNNFQLNSERCNGADEFENNNINNNPINIYIYL